MIIIEVICKRWLLPDWVRGICLYPFIFYNGAPRETLRRHEWVHVEQVRRDGWFRFYGRYLWDMIRRKPYIRRKYEVEAYAKQNDGQQPWLRDHG